MRTPPRASRGEVDALRLGVETDHVQPIRREMGVVPAVEVVRARGARAEQLVAGRQGGRDLQRARAPAVERRIERRAVAAVAREREAEVVLNAQARGGDLPAGRAREA